jgi:hypothetical protein
VGVMSDDQRNSTRENNSTSTKDSQLDEKPDLQKMTWDQYQAWRLDPLKHALIHDAD